MVWCLCVYFLENGVVFNWKGLSDLLLACRKDNDLHYVVFSSVLWLCWSLSDYCCSWRPLALHRDYDHDDDIEVGRGKRTGDKVWKGVPRPSAGAIANVSCVWLPAWVTGIWCYCMVEQKKDKNMERPKNACPSRTIRHHCLFVHKDAEN